ncbi:MAG TPA: hypothetical protein VG268_21550 [Streptosporangiaceae bacterium]|nr:hypothetical protein [Streptosporangiaceae bacterium]
MPGSFRNRLYARMEEISFRTSITVLTGVTAVAAVIAGVGLLMSQSPAPARPAALGPAPASHSAPATPASATPSASQPAPTSAAPSRTPAPVVTSPAREATYPATAENSRPVRNAPATASHAAPSRSVSPAVAAWLAWWQQVLASHRGGGLGTGHGGPHRGRR